MCVYVDVCVCACVHMCVYVCVCVSVCVCRCECTHTCVWLYVCLCRCVCQSVCVSLCVEMYKIDNMPCTIYIHANMWSYMISVNVLLLLCSLQHLRQPEILWWNYFLLYLIIWPTHQVRIWLQLECCLWCSYNYTCTYITHEYTKIHKNIHTCTRAHAHTHTHIHTHVLLYQWSKINIFL